MSAITSVLSAIHPSLATLQGVPLWVFLLVLVLAVAFLVVFLVQGPRVWWQLRSAAKATRAAREANDNPEPDEVGNAFSSEPLRHIWEEYRDTLHPFNKAGSGANAVYEWRATVPADSMFTREVLVDSRLFDEFTRHLPGVLTGLGIIGTFAGLLTGLRGFKTSPIEEAMASLPQLLEGVQHAFYASGFAIACAMLVVFVSRLLLAFLYNRVERLTHAIDKLYQTGVGEEYLGRLVKSAAENAASTAQLKDALVEDLKKMMTELVDRQIAEQAKSSLVLGQTIGDSIATAMAGPMEQVRKVIETTARGNGEQVSSMLETLLTGFMAKLEDTFGGQMRGINEGMQRSMEAMSTVQSSLQGLLADIQKSNQKAADHMSGALEEAIKKAAENQQLMTDQLREFVQEFRTLVSEEQAKSQQAMDEAVLKVLGQVAAGVEGLENIRKAAAAEEADRHVRLTGETNALVGGLATQVDALLATVTEQVAKTQANIEAVQQVSIRAIDGMNTGASTISTAALRFEQAGGAVSGVMDRSSKVSETLAATAASLQSTTSLVQRSFEQYDATRRSVETHVASLTGLIESARREAGISQGLVDSMKASAEALRRAEEEQRKHLEGVNAMLARAFSEFGTQLVSSVRTATAETDKHVSQAVGHLSGVVQAFGFEVQRMRRNV